MGLRIVMVVNVAILGSKAFHGGIAAGNRGGSLKVLY